MLIADRYNSVFIVFFESLRKGRKHDIGTAAVLPQHSKIQVLTNEGMFKKIDKNFKGITKKKKKINVRFYEKS